MNKQQEAIQHAKRALPEFVYDAAQLEGINFTLIEVKTLLDGVTIGGKKLSDQEIVINQKNAWEFLFDAISRGIFGMSSSFVCKLHSIAGLNEALEWGKFRSKEVTIAGTKYCPPKATDLVEHWNKIEHCYASNFPEEKIYTYAIEVFLKMARYKFFFDVNKRMGRFMMNGILLSHGYPAINLPSSSKEEFNKLMLEFYPTGKTEAMVEFMKSHLDERIVSSMGYEIDKLLGM
ncbi:Fic family protein [Candidatus Sneabacter namystus]|uniref:Cell filamentation protein Fic n=1 Tax=Candidatus Sneabacter namystus TaxID=2601646 RepID=A0A5C0UGU5_9RICK|nr:Fic family protein [Candidatus Sneabacter namystus]QEK39346.1 cell filamentation protein Fic [Candidatus Sneabacter namystus]